MHLTDVLRGYGKLGIYPMHMPGHKRNPSFFSLPSPYEIDFTEVEGLDMLHDAQGILLDGMRRAAGLYGSSHTFYLVNGSTCGILSGITSCTRKGDRILVARNCHQSVYNAIGLQDLQAVYLLPEPDLAFGIWGSVSPAQVKRALDQYQDIRLIVLTSPTYEGVVSDISAIAKLSHERGIPLLVDEAHGAHLGFSPKFPQNSVQAGADLVIHSLHKTLPAPTQAALIHINGTLVDPEQVRRQLAVFETSSPSYVLMAGIDSCVNLLLRQAGGLFQAYTRQLDSFSRSMHALQTMRIFCKGRDALEQHSSVFDFDPGKIVISVRNTGLCGTELMDRLLRHYRIQLELGAGDYAIAMTSICDTPEGFRRLGRALKEIDAALSFQPEPPAHNIPSSLPDIVLPIAHAQAQKGHFVPLAQSAAQISREYIFAYPPGIPLIAPGERISPQILNSFSSLANRCVPLKSTYGHMPREINVTA